MAESQPPLFFRVSKGKDTVREYLEIQGALEASRYIIETLCDYLQEEHQEKEPIGETLTKLINTIKDFSPAFLPLYKLQNYHKHKYVQDSTKEEIIASLRKSIKQINHSISGFGVRERDLSMYGVGKRVLVLGFPPQIAELISAIRGIEEVRIMIPLNFSENNKRLLINRVNKCKKETTDKEISVGNSFNIEEEVKRADNIFLETWGIVQRSLQGCVVHLPDQAKALLKEASIWGGRRLFGVASATLQCETDILLDGIARHISHFSGIIVEDAFYTARPTGYGIIEEQV